MEAIKHDERAAVHHEDAPSPGLAEQHAAPLRKQRTLAERLAAVATAGASKSPQRRRKTRLTERLARVGESATADAGRLQTSDSLGTAPLIEAGHATAEAGFSGSTEEPSAPRLAHTIAGDAETQHGRRSPGPDREVETAASKMPAAETASATLSGETTVTEAAEPASADPDRVRAWGPARMGIPAAAVALAFGAYLATPPTTLDRLGAWLTGDTAAYTASTMRVARQRTPKPAAPRPEIAVLHAAEPISIEIGKAAPLQLGIDKPALLPANSFVLVRGMPERAMLSSGHPIGAGTWILKPTDLTGLSLTIFAVPVVKPHLAVEVLSDQGDVIASAGAEIALVPTFGVKRAGSARPVSTAATYPPLKAEAAAKGGRHDQDERLPARKGRQASRSPLPAKQPLAVAPVTAAPAATQSQPKSKTAWKMDWSSLATGR